jgi:hypothetical protein
MKKVIFFLTLLDFPFLIWERTFRYEIKAPEVVYVIPLKQLEVLTKNELNILYPIVRIQRKHSQGHGYI